MAPCAGPTERLVQCTLPAPADMPSRQGWIAPSDLNGDSSRYHAGRESANRSGGTNRPQTLSVDSPASSNGWNEARSARLKRALARAKLMDSGAILHELTYANGLPRAALQAASAQCIGLLPKFLGVIEDYL